MYQRDFILRMVEMLAELIAGILGYIKKGEFQQAEESIERIYYDFLKKDASFFRSIDKDKLTTSLLDEHNYTNGHLDILAELFYAEGELNFAKGNKSKSLEYFEKSLILHTYSDGQSKSFSFEKQEKISKIQERIQELGN